MISEIHGGVTHHYLSSTMKSYFQIDLLKIYYFEDSYVLEVVATPGRLTFDMDLVLTSDHPEYRPAPANEQYCYRRGGIEFSGVTDLAWKGQGLQPAQDVTGQVDYGNIDSFLIEGDRYELAGDFGSISVTASGIDVRLAKD
jgi:hypothetical protein